MNGSVESATGVRGPVAGHTISVVLPAYNVERYIRELLVSLVSQTVSFHEIFVVDDGSTDSTRSIVREFQERYPIIVLEQKNSGVGAARNLGLARATGEYIYFVDADDIVGVDFVERMQGLLSEHEGSDLVFFSGEDFLDPESEPNARLKSHDRKLDGVWETGVLAALELVAHKAYIPVVWLYVSRRSLWIENGLEFWNNPYEDQWLIDRLVLLAQRTIVRDVRLYRRRIREGSLALSRLTGRHEHALLALYQGIVEQMRSAGCGRDCRRLLRTRLRPIFIKYMRVCFSLGHKPEIGTYLKSCLRAGLPPSFGIFMKYFRYRIHFDRWLRY